MIAPVPVPPCGHCYDLSRLYRPWVWPPSDHAQPLFPPHGTARPLLEYLTRLPSALDASRA